MGYFNSIYSSELPHRARAVYMYLKDRADKDGTCWPSIRTISRELGLSRATVCRALDDLCKAGLISREQRWRENGGKIQTFTNFYRAHCRRADFPPRGRFALLLIRASSHCATSRRENFRI